MYADFCLGIFQQQALLAMFTALSSCLAHKTLVYSLKTKQFTMKIVNGDQNLGFVYCFSYNITTLPKTLPPSVLQGPLSKCLLKTFQQRLNLLLLVLFWKIKMVPVKLTPENRSDQYF